MSASHKVPGFLVAYLGLLVASELGCLEVPPAYAAAAEEHVAARSTESAVGPDGGVVDEKLAAARVALLDDEADVRRAAVAELVQLGGAEAAATMAAVVARDEEPTVRVEAVIALGVIGTATSVPALESALIDPCSEVREKAIAALADIGGEASARALGFALQDEDVSLRADAVYALGDIGGTIAIRVLQQALADERRSVRDAAADVLVELASAER